MRALLCASIDADALALSVRFSVTPEPGKIMAPMDFAAIKSSLQTGPARLRPYLFQSGLKMICEIYSPLFQRDVVYALVCATTVDQDKIGMCLM
ncbi:MAG: hypothetical protein HRT36_00655 [Alphaproteobacteria bacterium]|nr:hypothetical protein [Alphaproteobacteria bacterium]